MGVFDSISTPQENAAPSGGVFGAVTPTAPAPSTGSVFSSVKVAGAPSTPSVTTPPPTAPSTSPYFQGYEKSGTFVGVSDESDPFSGRPFLAYKEPGQATTTDSTRTAPKMNPEIAAPTDKDNFENERMPESASQDIRKEDGATSDEQLDHQMALAVGGSNDKSNLKVVPTEQNQAASGSEKDMAGQVAAGTMSLFQAQAKEAADKGLPAPFTDTAKKASILSNIADSPAGSLLAKIRDSILGFGTKATTPETQPLTPIKTIAKDSVTGIKGIVDGFVNQYKNPSPLEKAMETSNTLPEIIKAPETAVMRTIEPIVESFVTNIASSIIFNTPDLYAHFVNNIAQNGANGFAQNIIAATEKSPTEVVGDTAQAVLGAYMPEIFGEGMAEFGTKGIPQAIVTAATHGAAAGATFGAAQAASSGSKDPKELAAIVLQNTVGGALLGMVSGGVGVGLFKAPEAISAIKDRLPKNMAEAQRGFVKLPGMGDEDESSEQQSTPSTPASSEDAATQYREQVLEPQAAEGKPVVIGADDMKTHFGEDYDIKNHPIYSKAAYDLVPEMAQKNDNPKVIYTAGGPGSGKSELVRAEAEDGFNGVIVDSNLSKPEGAAKQIEQLRAMGKQPEIHMILQDPARAYHFTKMREAEGGHPISEASFVNNHAADGVPASVLKLAQEHNVPLKLIDARKATSPEAIRDIEPESDPIATLKKVAYTKEQLQGIVGDYGSTPEQQQTLTKIQKRSVSSSSEDRSNTKGETTRSGQGGRVLRSGERVNTKLEQMAEKSSSFNGFYERAGVTMDSLDATAKAKGYESARDFYNKNKPKPIKPTRNVAELTREITELKSYIEYHDEMLKGHGGKGLLKFYGNQNPRFENLDDIFARNVDRGTKAKVSSLDTRVEEHGYTTPAEAHEGVLEYLDEKDRNKELHTQLSSLEKELKDANTVTKNAEKDAKVADKIGKASEMKRRGDETAFSRQQALTAAKEQEQLKGYTRPVIVDKNGKERFGVDPLANPSNFYKRMGEVQKADPDRSLNIATHMSREDIGNAIERQKKLQDARIAKAKAIEKSQGELPRKLSFRDKVRGALKPISSLPDDIKVIAKEWQGSLLTASELANRERGEIAGTQTKIEKNGTRIIIKKSPIDKAMPTDEAVNYYTAIQHGKFSPLRATFDRLYSYAARKGLDIPYRKDYLPQVYKEPLGDVKVAIIKYMRDFGVDEDVAEGYVQGVMQLPIDVSNRLKIHPSFEEAKAFPTYGVAAKYGLHPKFTNPVDLAVNYRYELEKSIANKNFVTSLIDKGKMLPNDLAPQHWEHVTTNFVKGDLYAPPELAHMLNELYKNQASMGIFDTAVHYLGLVSRKAQEISLSGAIPYTNIHFFSIGQLIKEFTAGNFKAVGPFVRANSLEATEKWFQKNQIYSDMMARQGIDISSRMGSIKQVYESLSHNMTFMDKIGIQFRKAFLDKSFGTFLPSLYTQVFKDTYDGAIGRGMDEATAERFAGDVTKKNFGLLGSEARARATSDTLSGIFFAPVFRESVFGTIANAMRSVTSEWRNPEFYRNRRLVAGMAVTFGMYQVFNKMMNGQFTWQNPNGHEFELRIPLPGGENMYIPWMPSFLALPRAAATAGISIAKGDFPTAEQQTSNMFSLPLQVGVQVLANKDYFGGAIYKATDSGAVKTGKIAAYLGLSVSHPYVKAVADMVTKKQPLYQTLSEAATLPFKFQSDKAISQGAFYTALQASANKNANNAGSIAPTYEQVQALVAQGKTAQATAIVDGLSDEQYKAYTSYKKSQTASQTTKDESAQYTQYKQIQTLISQGKTSQAEAIVDGMTDDEYHAYSLLKTRFGSQ